MGEESLIFFYSQGKQTQQNLCFQSVCMAIVFGHCFQCVCMASGFIAVACFLLILCLSQELAALITGAF
jgi:glycerol-3-phosphate acyltransferase PlsY